MKALLAFRGDGVLARVLGRLPVTGPSSVLAVLAVLPLAWAIGFCDRTDGLVAAVFGWLILFGGLSRAADAETDHFRWTVPPLLRAGEYVGLIWLHPAGAFAVLLALAFHHYDLVYRLRYQGRTAPGWLRNVAGGWDGRLVAAWILLAAGALPEGFYAAGAILGALFAAESVASWRNFSADDRPALYDDEQGDAE